MHAELCHMLAGTVPRLGRFCLKSAASWSLASVGSSVSLSLLHALMWGLATGVGPPEPEATQNFANNFSGTSLSSYIADQVNGGMPVQCPCELTHVPLAHTTHHDHHALGPMNGAMSCHLALPATDISTGLASVLRCGMMRVFRKRMMMFDRRVA